MTYTTKTIASCTFSRSRPCDLLQCLDQEKHEGSIGVSLILIKGALRAPAVPASSAPIQRAPQDRYEPDELRIGGAVTVVRGTSDTPFCGTR
jgi:hypothetical protein